MNPTALVFIALCAVLGALWGHVLVGLAVALGIVLLADLTVGRR